METYGYQNFFVNAHDSYQVQESAKTAQLKVRAKQENVSGVMLPVFESYNAGGNGNLQCFAQKNDTLWYRKKSI
jgi:vacuolar-type H+-ATPase subunit D/Vma8